ncbi:MAG TPA: cytochrome c oxidase subunit II, partial [Acidimicrobiales bacterium]|nr:cytochrome c oxidase subunit II [Acidimicrobiales bacterium]
PHRRRVWAVVAFAAVVLAGCGDSDLPQNALDPEGPVARQLDRLWTPVFLIAAAIFFLVEGLVLYAAIRFRRRSEDEAPRQVHGDAKLELTWTIIPALILTVVGVLTVATLFDIDRKPTGADVLRVRVTGHQWWWEYEYPDHDVVTANELHIPTGTKVAIDLRASDVIHSFWVPKLAGKVDAIPGVRNDMVIEADRPGTYHGQCAEFCGLSHADMRLRVVAHTPARFQRWLESNAQPAALPDPVTKPLGTAGAKLFREKGCTSCHAVKGLSAGQLGPDLTHLAQRETFAGAVFDLNDVNLRLWLRDPPRQKEGAKMPNLGLSEDEITQLIAYLNTLK